MGDQAAWGRSARSAFEGARFRLLLSGTPFRSDNTPIPWITYDDEGVSRADYAYGYTDALLDGVCRPVTFHTYDGDMEWMSDGRRRKADFSVGLPAAEAARRLRTALDPEGDWTAQVLRDADARLTDLRSGPHPDAGGLVVVIDMENADRLAERLGDERRTLMAAVSRRTGEAHRAIHGRINRETGAPSVTAASVEQLERGNRLLERQANRRR
jgi:superfamily II DNA or RNA helicase